VAWIADGTPRKRVEHKAYGTNIDDLADCGAALITTATPAFYSNTTGVKDSPMITDRVENFTRHMICRPYSQEAWFLGNAWFGSWTSIESELLTSSPP
jgi:hypothetical protein